MDLSRLEVTSPRAKEAKKLTISEMDKKRNSLIQLRNDTIVELEVEKVKALGGGEFIEPPIEDVVLG